MQEVAAGQRTMKLLPQLLVAWVVEEMASRQITALADKLAAPTLAAVAVAAEKARTVALVVPA